MTLDTSISDATVAATHRAVWALGDYALMAEEVMAPLGPILVSGHRHRPGVLGPRRRRRLGQYLASRPPRPAPPSSPPTSPRSCCNGRRPGPRHRGLAIDYREANAQALPFGDGEFDIVMSAIGVQFAPDHQRAADELVRVCRPGGTIGVISWTPEGFFGRMLATIGRTGQACRRRYHRRRCGDVRATSPGCWETESATSPRRAACWT